MDLIRDIPKILEENKLILFVIDGLGKAELNIPLRSQIYRTVFPSSTSTFFYSLASLLEPEEHGFLEWNMRFRDTIVTVPPWITIDGKELTPGEVSRREVFPFKSLSEILWEKGFSSTIFSPFATSVFTRYSAKKSRRIEISFLSQIFPLPDSDFIFIYWPSIDSILHEKGKGECYNAELQLLSTFINLLWKRIQKGTKLIILGDHGLTEVSRRYTLPVIGSIPVGGSRVAFYRGVKKEEVEEELKIPAKVFHIKEIMKNPVRRCYKNFGEIIVVAKGGAYFRYPWENERSKMAHGGLSREEMEIRVWIGEKISR